MNNYIMQFDNYSSSSLAWEYPYAMVSDKMAEDFAKGYAIQMNQDLIVFKDGEFLASIKVKTITTAEITHDPA